MNYYTTDDENKILEVSSFGCEPHWSNCNQTEDEIVRCENQLMLKSEFEALSQTDEYIAEQLKKAKEAKLQENATKRDEHILKGAEYESIYFDADADSKVNVMFKHSVMADTETVVWYGVDNDPLLCNKQDLANIGLSITTLTTFVWAYKNPEFVEAINNAETLAELEAIEIDYNSAKIFGIQ